MIAVRSRRAPDDAPVTERAYLRGMSTLAAPSKPKPLLRGWSHAAAFLASLFAGGVLVGSAAPGRGLVAGIYVLGLAALFGTSGLYHTPRWSLAARARMRRLDHAAIFLLIAGTYTPICTLVLGGDGVPVLVAVWVGAAVGMAQALLGLKVPRFVLPLLYVGLGWLVVLRGPQLWSGLGTREFVLLAAGGLLYTIGAAVYGLRWPNPRPRVFGYHEVFHLLVIGAAVLHFVAVAAVVHA